MTALTGDSSSARSARAALIVLFALVVGGAGLFRMPPLDRDESRFAQATAQMLESGDFVSIRFQDEERNKKPAGIHWLQAASVAAFSSVEAREIWAYRLPSLAGAVIAALFTYAAGARLFGPAVGLLAALLLASAPALAGEATIAKTDAALLAAVAAAQAAFAHICANLAEGSRARWRWALLYWFAIAAGVLIKGPIILMVVGLSAVAMMFRERPRALIAALRPVSGALILMLMIAPWAFAVNEATDGRFFVEAVGGDMLAKISDAKESHAGPPGYYSLLVFALFWPAAALIPAGLLHAIADRRSWRSAFLLAWAAPAWIIFELTATKLPHYVLPLYPAIALMAARAALDGTTDGRALARALGATIFVLVGIALAGAIATLPRLYQDEPSATFDVAALALVAASLSIGVLYWRARVIEATIAAVFVSAGLAWTLLAGVLPALDRLILSPRISAAIDAAELHPLKDGVDPAVLGGYFEPSAIFLLGTDTILADGRGAADAFSQSEGAAVVEGREDDAFRARLDELGAGANEIARIEGVNYSNGDSVTLRVYRPAPSQTNRRSAK